MANVCCRSSWWTRWTRYSFADTRNPAPDFSENGEPGEELDVTLELKLLADVGLVGFLVLVNQLIVNSFKS